MDHIKEQWFSFGETLSAHMKPASLDTLILCDAIASIARGSGSAQDLDEFRAAVDLFQGKYKKQIAHSAGALVMRACALCVETGTNASFFGEKVQKMFAMIQAMQTSDALQTIVSNCATRNQLTTELQPAPSCLKDYSALTAGSTQAQMASANIGDTLQDINQTFDDLSDDLSTDFSKHK